MKTTLATTTQRTSAPVLSAGERRELDRAEAVIAQGLRTFLEVGSALKTIRDRRLYRQGFSTFAQYVVERWGFQRARAYRLLAASEVVEEMSPAGDIQPANEAQVKPLVGLKTRSERLRAWRMALKAATRSGRAVTAPDVESAVEKIKSRQANGAASPNHKSIAVDTQKWQPRSGKPVNGQGSFAEVRRLLQRIKKISGDVKVRELADKALEKTDMLDCVLGKPTSKGGVCASRGN